MTKTLVRTGARVWSRLSKVKQWMISRFDPDFHCIISLSNNFRALSSSCHLVLVEEHISLTFHAHICISSHVARKSWGNFQRWNKRFACGLMNKMPPMLPRSVVQFLSEPLHIFATMRIIWCVCRSSQSPLQSITSSFNRFTSTLTVQWLVITGGDWIGMLRTAA